MACCQYTFVQFLCTARFQSLQLRGNITVSIFPLAYPYVITSKRRRNAGSGLKLGDANGRRADDDLGALGLLGPPFTILHDMLLVASRSPRGLDMQGVFEPPSVKLFWCTVPSLE